MSLCHLIFLLRADIDNDLIGFLFSLLGDKLGVAY